MPVRLVKASATIVHGNRHHRLRLAVAGDLNPDNIVADIDSPDLLLVVVADCYGFPRPFCVQHANTSYLIPPGVILAPLKMNPRILNGNLIKNHRILNGSSNNVFIFPLLLVLPMFGWRRDLWAQDFPHILACNWANYSESRLSLLTQPHAQSQSLSPLVLLHALVHASWVENLDCPRSAFSAAAVHELMA